MTDFDHGDHRYRGLITFTDHDTYKGFVIEQAPPKPGKLGVGPYRVMFRGKEIFRAEYSGDCKRHVEKIVESYRKLTLDYIAEWRLPGFPRSDEI